MQRIGTILYKSWLPIVAFLFFTSTIFGAIRNYSPIPFWDMWDGYIGFYERVSKGDWGSWWAQHNEHRLFVPGFSFGSISDFFHGLPQLLIPLNLLLMTLLWAALLLGTRHLFKDRLQKGTIVTAAALLAMVCFSRMQKENII